MTPFRQAVVHRRFWQLTDKPSHPKEPTSKQKLLLGLYFDHEDGGNTFFETSLSVYQTTWRHIWEDTSLLLTCIAEVTGSNIPRVTGHPDWGSPCFTSVRIKKSAEVFKLLLLLPHKSSPIITQWIFYNPTIYILTIAKQTIPNGVQKVDAMLDPETDYRN
jgi:hypothetical protein